MATEGLTAFLSRMGRPCSLEEIKESVVFDQETFNALIAAHTMYDPLRES